jgi:predicted extracellular nuclease
LEETPAVDPTERLMALRVATWNVENLFRPGEGGIDLSKAAYQRKLDHIAGLITGANVDVLALQEIGTEEALADLQAAAGDRYPHQAVASPDTRGIRVALLSRYPIADAWDLIDYPENAMHDVPAPEGEILDAMGRGVLETVIDTSEAETPHDALRVVTAHLKSKLSTYPDGRRYPKDEDERARGTAYSLFRRSAEAAALRVWLNASMTEDTDTPVVCMGDFNDSPDAVTTTMLYGPEDGDPKRPDQGDPVRLYNLADQLPAGRRYSRIYRNKRELLDHVLVSRPLLLAGVKIDSMVEGIEPITESVRTRADEVVPDHACQIATLG